MIPAALIVGAITGLGLLFVVRGIVPGQPQLKAALSRLDGGDQPTTAAVLDTETFGFTQRVGVWTSHRRLPTLALHLRPTDADLDLVGKSRTTLMGEKTILAVAGLVLPPMAGLFANTISLPLPIAPPFIVGIVCAVGLWFVPDLQIKSLAKSARTEFARAVSTYLELLAIERAAGAGASQSAFGAAQVARSWPFRRISQSLQRARWEGKPAWTALEELGEAVKVPELLDVAEIIGQAGAHGSAVHEQLQGRARTMREAQLATEVQLAHAATTRMWAIVPLTAFVYFALLIFPAGISLLTM
jgi:Flp pilus assembly protein TadB